MVNTCYLCDRKVSKVDNISLHRFPKDLSVRKKWLNACGLNTNDNVERIRICSRHFVDEDFCQSNFIRRVTPFIKRNAVPKLLLTNPLIIGDSDDLPLETPMLKPCVIRTTKNKNKTANQSSLFSSDTITIDDNYFFENIKKSPEHCYELNSIEDPLLNDSTKDIDEVDPLENDDSNQCNKNRTTNSSNEVADGNNLSSQCKKRSLEARYVSQISLLDFATPHKAEKTIRLIKRNNEKKTKKMNQLQRRVRYLKKRVKTLNNIINYFKNYMLTNKSIDTLMK